MRFLKKLITSRINIIAGLLSILVSLLALYKGCYDPAAVAPSAPTTVIHQENNYGNNQSVIDQSSTVKRGEGEQATVPVEVEKKAKQKPIAQPIAPAAPEELFDWNLDFGSSKKSVWVHFQNKKYQLDTLDGLLFADLKVPLMIIGERVNLCFIPGCNNLKMECVKLIVKEAGNELPKCE